MQNRGLISRLNDQISSSPDWASPLITSKESPFATSLKSEKEVSPQHENGNSEHYDDNLLTDELEQDDEAEERRRLVSSSSFREDYTLEFFRPILTADSKERVTELESITNLLNESLSSPTKELVKAHLKTIVRFSGEVPFDDVAEAFQKFIKRIEEEGSLVLLKKIPNPSFFIPKRIVPPVNTSDPTIRQLFVELFLQTARVSHLHRVLALHPTYLEKYQATFNFIMRDSGPLPLDWRNYLAILAAARTKCKWLVDLEEQEFVLNGGNPKWLGGVANIPKKLANLLEINQLLCHQPWLISKQHIAAIVKGEDSWSIGELVHAMLIICTFSSLSGMVFGSGVTPELDFIECAVSNDDPEEEEPSKEGSGSFDDTKKLEELLKGGWKPDVEDAPSQKYQLFEKAETVDGASRESTASCQVFIRYVGDLKMEHEDFDVKSKHYEVFRVQDYNWKEDGFELVRRFMPGAATLLDEEFDHIYNMTYNMLNQNTGVDTFPFRRAVWQYVQRIKGMMHDDYNYQEVNIFLNRGTKSFVKKIACRPDGITKDDYRSLGISLRPDEKVHVALLATESAKQSALLYGLHAVMRHMYNR